jgi:ketosteroid isomerase-like protein
MTLMKPPQATEAHLEATRRALDAFNRRDVEAMIALAADEFEIDWTRSLGPMQGVFRGREGLEEYLREQWEIFDEFNVEPLELTPCGERHVLVTTRVHATGRGGIPVSATSSHLYTFEDGRLARVTLYQQPEEAIADAEAPSSAS